MNKPWKNRAWAVGDLAIYCPKSDMYDGPMPAQLVTVLGADIPYKLGSRTRPEMYQQVIILLPDFQTITLSVDILHRNRLRIP